MGMNKDQIEEYLEKLEHGVYADASQRTVRLRDPWDAGLLVCACRHERLHPHV